MLISSVMILQKVILGGIIIAVIIIAIIGVIGLTGESEKIKTNDQSINQEPYVPKHITLQLSDGINMGENNP